MRWALRFLLGLLVLVFIVICGFRGAAVLRETQTLAVLRPATGTSVATSKGALFVTSTGTDGVPLLLTHGTGAWGGLWQETADAIAPAGYVVHAVDLPPFGFSERSASWDYSRPAQADRLLALVSAMEMRPIVVAHSFGAGPAVVAVMKDPEAFAGLVIVDGALGLGQHDNTASLPRALESVPLRRTLVSLTLTNPLVTRMGLAQMIHRKEAATSDRVAILKQPMRGVGLTESIAQWLPNLLRAPADALSTRADAYRALAVPTVLIWGDQDTITPLEQGQALAELIPGAQLVVMRDVGHIPQIEDPAAFQRILIAVLGGISAGGDGEL